MSMFSSIFGMNNTPTPTSTPTPTPTHRHVPTSVPMKCSIDLTGSILNGISLDKQTEHLEVDVTFDVAEEPIDSTHVLFRDFLASDLEKKPYEKGGNNDIFSVDGLQQIMRIKELEFGVDYGYTHTQGPESKNTIVVNKAHIKSLENMVFFGNMKIHPEIFGIHFVCVNEKCYMTVRMKMIGIDLEAYLTLYPHDKPTHDIIVEKISNIIKIFADNNKVLFDIKPKNIVLNLASVPRPGKKLEIELLFIDIDSDFTYDVTPDLGITSDECQDTMKFLLAQHLYYYSKNNIFADHFREKMTHIDTPTSRPTQKYAREDGLIIKMKQTISAMNTVKDIDGNDQIIQFMIKHYFHTPTIVAERTKDKVLYTDDKLYANILYLNQTTRPQGDGTLLGGGEKDDTIIHPYPGTPMRFGVKKNQDTYYIINSREIRGGKRRAPMSNSRRHHTSRKKTFRKGRRARSSGATRRITKTTKKRKGGKKGRKGRKGKKDNK